MEQTKTETTSPPRVANELVRPVQGRMVAGVAAGLAKRFDTPEWLPRLFFALTAFVGGIGVALYIAGWVLIRSEDEDDAIAARFFSNAGNPGAWVGIGLVVLATVILIDNFTFIDSGVMWAAIILVVGVLLYLGHISLPGGSSGPEDETAEGADTVTAPTKPLPAVTTATGGQTPPPPSVPPVPAVPTPPILPPKAQTERSMLGRITIGVAILAMGVLALLDRIPDVAIDADPRHYFALAMTIIGLGLLVGAVWGRARWLILIGVLLGPALLVGSMADFNWSSDEWAVSHSPAEFADLRSPLSVEFGNMSVDLTELPWDGERVAMEMSVDVGNLEVRVPADVAVAGRAEVDVGHVSAFGRESGGIGDTSITLDEPGNQGTLIIDASVDIGNIEIVREK